MNIMKLLLPSFKLEVDVFFLSVNKWIWLHTLNYNYELCLVLHYETFNLKHQPQIPSYFKSIDYF